jgi:beta-galactosidase
VKTPARQVHLSITADTTVLAEEDSYDVATVHIEAIDENGNHLSYYQEPLRFEASGAIELIGPELVSMQGGWSGTYVKTKGEAGQGRLVITGGSGASEILFEVEIPSQVNKRETGE